MVEALDGPEAVLAHVDYTSGPPVGRYQVDVSAFERVALPAIERARTLGGIIILDELGRMELASPAFVAAMKDLFAADVLLAATVHAFSHPVTDELKRRDDVRVTSVTHENRDRLPHQVMAWLRSDHPES